MPRDKEPLAAGQATKDESTTGSFWLAFRSLTWRRVGRGLRWRAAKKVGLARSGMAGLVRR
jgi:hypothetical protein